MRLITTKQNVKIILNILVYYFFRFSSSIYIFRHYDIAFLCFTHRVTEQTTFFFGHYNTLKSRLRHNSVTFTM